MEPWLDKSARFVSKIDAPGYVFGDDGSAWSSISPPPPIRLRRGLPPHQPGSWVRISNPGQNRYCRILLRTRSGKLPIGLHRLILTLFVGPPLPGQQACHLNHDPHDNRMCNLAWGSCSENMEQSKSARRIAKARQILGDGDPTMARGTTPTQVRLTDEDKRKIEEIRVLHGLPSMASAIRFAVESLHRRSAKKPGKSKDGP